MSVVERAASPFRRPAGLLPARGRRAPRRTTGRSRRTDEDGKEELVEEEEGTEQECAVLPILFLDSGSAPGTRPGTLRRIRGSSDAML